TVRIRVSGVILVLAFRWLFPFCGFCSFLGRASPMLACCDLTRAKCARRRLQLAPAAAQDFGIELLPFGAAVEHELGSDEGRLDAVERGRNLLRGRDEFAPEHELLPLTQHEVVEQ